MNRQLTDAGDAGAWGAGVRGSGPSLQNALDTLGDGCSLLVTGDVPTDAHRVAAARYFGDPSNLRRRVLGLTHDTPRPNEWLPGTVTADSDHTEVVRMDDALRNPVAADDSPAGDGGFSSTPNGEFRSRFLDAIERVSGHETPGDLQLRVGLLRVDGLRAALGENEAGRLLSDVAAATRNRGGMAHFHLPRRSADEGAPRSDPMVDAVATQLGEQLDVIVELRLRETAAVPEERWNIQGWGSTDWHLLA